MLSSKNTTDSFVKTSPALRSNRLLRIFENDVQFVHAMATQHILRIPTSYSPFHKLLRVFFPPPLSRKRFLALSLLVSLVKMKVKHNRSITGKEIKCHF